MEHHETLSPSMMPALSRCPCYKKGEGNIYSEIGTNEHKLLEKILTNKINIKSDNNVVFPELTFESIENVNWAAEEIKAIIGNNTFQCEQKLTLLDDNFNVVTFGTADVVSGNFLIDYKSGEMRDYTEQMTCYALMMMEGQGFSNVHIFEVYGRKRQVKHYEIGYVEAKATITNIINNVTNPDKKPTPCSYCQWCGDFMSCPEINKSITTIAKNREDWSLKEYHSSKITDPTEMAKALKMAKILSKWCESVEFHAKDMMLKGGNLPGYKLDKRGGKREIKDILKAYDITDIGDEFFKACSISITKLEDIYVACNPDMAKKAAKEQINDRLKNANLIELGAEQILIKEVK